MNVYQIVIILMNIPVLLYLLLRRTGPGSQRRLAHWTVLLSILGTITVFYYLVYRFAVNIPAWDDFDSILAYLNAAPGDKLQHLFSFHNEHRIVLTRLAADLSVSLMGSVDFRFLIAVGNSALVAVVLMWAGLLQSRRLSGSFMPALVLLIMLPSSWTNMIWATGAVQNYFVLLFVLLSFILFNRRTAISAGSALFFLILATISSAPGWFGFLILIVWIVFSPPFREAAGGSRWFFWAVLTVFSVTTALYFTGYHKPESHPEIIYALQHPVVAVKYFLSFMGGWLPFKPWLYIVSILEGAFWFYLLFRRYDRRNPVVFYFMLFVVMNAAAAVLTRSGFGVAQAIEPRYRIVPVMGLICTVFAFIEILPDTIRRGRFFGAALHGAAVLLYCIILGGVIPRLQNHRQALVDKMEGWQTTGHGLYYPEAKAANAERIITEAVGNGVYMVPDYITAGGKELYKAGQEESGAEK
ncbi:hypothetical protein JXO52_17570 [bacterium]|nr:hypothetical protein [bacterium]